MRKRVCVLGGTGMLGSMVTDYLARRSALEVTATARSEPSAVACGRRFPSVRWRAFDALSVDLTSAPGFFDDCDWVINCIGIIKPLIHDDDAFEVERALLINALFPHLLARRTEGGPRVLQIATDCAYSGIRGPYREPDSHDALDVYGKTKSLGEARAPHVHHLRCSIVGPELQSPKSLLEWFLGHPEGAVVNGFTNHRWNGVTTLHFAKLCGGIIENDLALPHLQHLIPQGSVSKCELLRCAAQAYGRSGVTVKPTEAALVVDRTLATDDKPLNRELWSAAGYLEPPTVPQLIEELARFDSRWLPIRAAIGADVQPSR